MFDALVYRWFESRYGAPTDIQSRAWPVIARAENALVIAPTGSGKTLTAFFSALEKLATGAVPTGTVRVVYVSPLKALNTDIRENLLEPLRGLRETFEAAGRAFPDITVMTRSGDTPDSERRRMTKHPPEILVTTPESLNIMLTSPRTRGIFAGVCTVILDEIHAIAGGKRGTLLMTAVERLALIAGEFQRIGISATVRPAEKVAEFLGGYALAYDGEQPRYTTRPVHVIESRSTKKIELSVRFPGGERPDAETPSVFEKFVGEWREIIAQKTSTLVFVNNRRHAEKITALINEGSAVPIAYAHHGSLSHELRAFVEARLKEGKLSAIVATSSLELGIDVGALDYVILAGTPPSVASALQRVGRSGHGVGDVSRGVLYPLHGRDIVDAAVMARAVDLAAIEPIEPPMRPLDILAQVIIAMTAVETWTSDGLFAVLRCAYPYHTLTRAAFDRVVEMLAGRYAETRIRDLNPRIVFDRHTGKITARDGAVLAVYHSGGAIVDRGYYALRNEANGAKIGELDEEFVWERRIGQSFLLGTQAWQIVSIATNDVTVRPAPLAGDLIPFWKAEDQHRRFSYAERVLDFLADAETRLDDPGFVRHLSDSVPMNREAAETLHEYLVRQRETAGIPHRRRVVIERPASDGALNEVIIHTLWGGRVNHAFRLLLEDAYARRYATRPDTFADDDAVIIRLPAEATDGTDEATIAHLIEQIAHDRAVADARAIATRIKNLLETSEFFGARFRENAARSLLLPKGGFGKRTPLWVTRMRAKRLFEVVSRHDDFPIISETWRECLEDAFDIAALRTVFDGIADGEIELATAVTAAPSPFASGLVWRQTNRYMYLGDEPNARSGSAYSLSVLDEVVRSPHLRPSITEEVARELSEKLARTAPGYAPDSPDELVLFVEESGMVPEADWAELVTAVSRDSADRRDSENASATVEGASDRLVWFETSTREWCIATIDAVPRILGALGLERESVSWRPAAGELPRERLDSAFGRLDREAPDATLAGFLAQWLRSRGPVSVTRVGPLFGPAGLDAVGELVEAGGVIGDIVIDDSDEPFVCDAENLGRALGMMRRKKRAVVQSRPITEFPRFLAYHQGVLRRGTTPDDLHERLERLFGYPAPVAVWETDILPARIDPYYPEWLDAALHETELTWFGSGAKRIAFVLAGDIELFVDFESDRRSLGATPTDAIPWSAPDARFTVDDVANAFGLPADDAVRRLWKAVFSGLVTADTAVPLRNGVITRFGAPSRTEPRDGTGLSAGRSPAAEVARRTDGRPRFSRAHRRSWNAAHPSQTVWRAVRRLSAKPDPIEAAEVSKDRVRQLLDRFGVVFRSLLSNELPALSWRNVFRTLRLMELSGEVTSGVFFEHIPGVQFTTARTIAEFGAEPSDSVYWMSAVDPASPCGLGLSELPYQLPSRLASNHIVYHDERLVLVSRRLGRDLTFLVDADEPAIGRYLAIFRDVSTRRIRPIDRIAVETVNGEPVRKSAYADALVAFGFRRDHKTFLYGPGYSDGVLR